MKEQTREGADWLEKHCEQGGADEADEVQVWGETEQKKEEKQVLGSSTILWATTGSVRSVNTHSVIL